MMFQGSDIYLSHCDETTFFSLVLKHHLAIYDLNISDHLIFRAQRKYRKQILETIPLTKFYYTRGLNGQLERFLLKKERIIVFFLSILFWFLLSHLIFNIQILGESLNHQKLIQESLQSYQAIPPFFLWDKNKLRQQLSDDLVEEIHWLTIHQEGGKLEIHYLPKNSQNEDTKDDLDLIAEKDGMIVAFDVKSGTKKVVINQFVAKDEVLVSHILLDSHNQEQTSLVEGKVYAYTFQEIGIEINKNSLPQFVQYYDCLLQIRQQLHEIISEGEHIVQEIPLIFEEKEDKIRMVNYYVLYEQIAVKRSFNE